MNEDAIREVCNKLGIHVEPSMGRGKLIDEIFGSQCESHYVQPTFIIDYPIEVSPLARASDTRPGITERFELFMTGREIANGFS